MVNDTFLKGRGADHVIFEVAKRLGEKHSVAVVTTTADFPEKNFKIIQIKGRKLLTGSWKDFLGFLQFFKYRKLADKFDIINLHHTTLNFAFIGKKNVVVTYHGSPPPTGEKSFRYFFRNLVNKTNRFSLRFNDEIITISKHAKKELIREKVPSEKINVIYNGVGPEFKSLKILKDENFMFFVGRHEHHKRIDELIKISKDLNFPLKIAGIGPETEKLKKLVKNLNAPIEFLGRICEKEKIKIYQKCSFFVSATRWEDYGLIFMEAAACRKPSIGYNICAIPEVILHGQTGFLANNYHELKIYCEKLIKDKEQRNKMGKNALKFSKEFNWDKTAEEYKKLFKMVDISV